MAVDVETDIVIARARDEVAAFAADPVNAPRWYENIRSVEWQTMMMRRANRKDLAQLKRVLEAS